MMRFPQCPIGRSAHRRMFPNNREACFHSACCLPPCANRFGALLNDRLSARLPALRIGNPCSLDVRPGGKAMVSDARRADDVHNRAAAYRQGVGDEGTVTAPWDGFGAHHGDGFGAGEAEKLLQTPGEFLRLHVVGEASERKVLPSGVGRVRFCPAESSKAGKMQVSYAGSLERTGKNVHVELRIVSGPWNRSHVDDQSDSVFLQQCDKFV